MKRAEVLPAKLKRPMPPEDLRFGSIFFAPADGVDAFVRAAFLDPASKLYIEEHQLLAQAQIGYLWAFPPAKDRDREILGTCQAIRPPQNKWSSWRSYDQVRRWFGAVDFVITLSAPHWIEQLNDAEALALLDHELCHCAQATGNYGQLLFDEDGFPKWTTRGHDVEQFVGPVARWGAAATGVEQLVAAANRKPLFGRVDIQRVVDGCGTCIGMAA